MKKNLSYYAREATGLSQTQFGDLVGRKQSTISAWENGQPLEEYHKCLLKQIRAKGTATTRRILPWLLAENKIGDALIVALGGVVDGPLGEFVQAAEKIRLSAKADHSTEDGSVPPPASSSES